MALSVGQYGSRHAGTGGWLLMRITAVMIALGLLGIATLLGYMPSVTYGAWHALFANLAVRIFLAVWLLAVTLHAYLGCDAILKDYVHAPGLRLVSLVGAAVALLSLTAYGFVVFFA
ncbi:MAG: succinate dehydrogenase, hydrophobic membrane anchor protein [Acidiferrobacter sp.]